MKNDCTLYSIKDDAYGGQSWIFAGRRNVDLSNSLKRFSMLGEVKPSFFEKRSVECKTNLDASAF